MKLALMIVLLVVCAVLTAVITIQVDRGEGMSGAVAGQSSNVFGKNKKANKADLLKKITIVTSIVFAVLVVVVNVID